MTVQLRGVVLAAVALLALPAAARAQGKSHSVGRSVRVAVVDLKKVIDQYRRSKDLDKKIEELKAGLRQKMVAKEKKISKMAQALKFLKRPSSEYSALTDNLQREKAELAAMRQQGEVMVRELFRGYVVGIYEDVERKIRETAKRDGFDLVFKKEDPGLGGRTERELSLKLNMKSVLYADARLDITERVVRALNTEYERTRRGRITSGKGR